VIAAVFSHSHFRIPARTFVAPSNARIGSTILD
jgi:hypothetical protein